MDKDDFDDLHSLGRKIRFIKTYEDESVEGWETTLTVDELAALPPEEVIRLYNKGKKIKAVGSTK